ncbi:ABC transporter permease YtrF precursor [Ruminiclostridium hungatei]|uniref:ABC transporter permease YtrF n=1 Tax=Ruminiclostridium hungatei TaxID=48256 RepID=A0A1V4SQ33_RUMHU|nr:FtsX-like permease family protein [Ruminiclostridium hungatei]OPX45960.1 ABC transporter permease YtrF precursor [Ruminiclostridium hungatei]
MRVFVKYMLKNVCEKKMRTFLILMSIIMSTAFFFSSGAIFDTMVNMLGDNVKSFYGTADIVIQPDENVQDNKAPGFFDIRSIEHKMDKVDYLAGIITVTARCRFNNQDVRDIAIIGANLNRYQEINTVSYIEEDETSPFEGDKIVISSNTAKEYGLKTGDKLELSFNGIEKSFTIAGIAVPKGLFLNESSNIYALIPIDVLWSLSNIKDSYNMAFIKLKNPADKPQVLTELGKDYENFTVKEPYTLKDIENDASQMSSTFMLMTIVVSMMSIFIIFTSFKVVTIERIPVIGTFRSIGATRGMTNLVLAAESLIYGLLGGVLGCVLGTGILYIMAVISKPSGMGNYKPEIEFSLVQLALSLLFAVGLSLVSCLIPISKVSRIPIKNVVLNLIDNNKKKSLLRPYIGLLILVLAFVMPVVANKQTAFIAGAGSLIFAVASAILLVPYIVILFVKLFGGIYALTGASIGSLAVKNLKDNKSILTNISLLAIGIASLLTINAISESIVNEVLNYYKNVNYDINISKLSQADSKIEQDIKQISNVSQVYSNYLSRSVELSDRKGVKLPIIQGVKSSDFQDFWKLDFLGDGEQMLKVLDSGRNIIVSTFIRDKLALKEGDILTLKLKGGDFKYKVTGFINYTMNNGNYALASDKYLVADNQLKFYSSIFIKTSGSTEEVIKKLKDKYGSSNASISSVAEMQRKDRQMNESIFIILRGFSIMALLIGLLGVVNNIIINLIERKRSIAVMRSIGMDRKQVRKMLLTEAAFGGFIGGVTGVFIGYVMIWGVPYLMSSMDMPMSVKYPFPSLPVYIIAAIACTIIASITPAFSSSKLNLIEAIKYE